MAFFNIPHPDTRGFPTTNLSSSKAAGVTALSVNNTAGLASTDYGLISTYGVSNAEIVRLNGGLTDTAFNLQAATVFAHAVDTQFTYLPYNQIALEYSSNLTTLIDSNVYTTIAEASAAATWSTLVTIDIEPSQIKTPYNDGDTTNRSYRYRFYNSTTAVYSTYSDPILPQGYEERTMGRLIEKVLMRMRKDVGQTMADQLTYDELFEEANNGIDDINDERKKWSHRRLYDQYFSDLTPGRNYVYLPRDIDVNYSRRSLISVKIKNGKPLDYITKEEFDEEMEDVIHTQSATTLTSASGTWTLDDTSDLPDTGSVVAIASGDQMSITFTANNRTTNVLTTPNCATEVTTTIPIDTDVWSNADFSSSPTEYTIIGRAIYFPDVPDETLYQRTCSGDYIQTHQRVNSESDVIKPALFTALFYYMLYALEDSLDHNKSESYYAKYLVKLNTMKRNEVTGQRGRFTINVNTGGKPVDPVRSNQSIT